MNGNIGERLGFNPRPEIGDPNDNDNRDAQVEKQFEQRISPPFLTTIDINDQQFERPSDSIRFGRQFDSYDTDESDSQVQKPSEQGTSTFKVIIIDFNLGQYSNAPDSTHLGAQFNSYEIDENDRQEDEWKQRQLIHLRPRVASHSYSGNIVPKTLRSDARVCHVPMAFIVRYTLKLM
jgi:hypothetical protein